MVRVSLLSSLHRGGDHLRLLLGHLGYETHVWIARFRLGGCQPDGGRADEPLLVPGSLSKLSKAAQGHRTFSVVVAHMC